MLPGRRPLACARARGLPHRRLVPRSPAAAPTFWTVSTQADFLKGDVEDLSIDSDGRVFLGPVTRARRRDRRAVPVDGARRRRTARCGRAPATKARSCKSPATARLRRSSTRPSSKSTRSRRRPAAASTSATSPDGKIYQVARRRHVEDASSIPTTSTSGRWRSRPTGNVFAATGDKGIIYKITPDGKGALFYKTNTTQRRVARDRQRAAT